MPIVLYIIGFTATFSDGSLFPVVPLYCKSIGLASVGAGLVITTIFASSSLSRAPAGRLSDRIGRRPIILLGSVFLSLGVASISQFQTLSYLVVSGILFGLGFGMSSPASFALVAELSSTKVMGLSMAIGAFCFHLGLAVGPTSMGVVAEATNFKIMFLVCASVLAIGVLAIAGLLKNRR